MKKTKTKTIAQLAKEIKKRYPEILNNAIEEYQEEVSKLYKIKVTVKEIKEEEEEVK